MFNVAANTDSKWNEWKRFRSWQARFVRQIKQLCFAASFSFGPTREKNWPPPRPWWNFPHNNWPGSANGSLHFVCCCSDLSLSFSSQLRWFYPAKVQLQFDFWNRIQFPIEWRVAGGDLLEQNPLWVDHDHDHPSLIMLLVMRRITRWWLHIFVEIEPNPQYKCWLLRKDINTSPSPPCEEITRIYYEARRKHREWQSEKHNLEKHAWYYTRAKTRGIICSIMNKGIIIKVVVLVKILPQTPPNNHCSKHGIFLWTFDSKGGFLTWADRWQ